MQGLLRAQHIAQAAPPPALLAAAPAGSAAPPHVQVEHLGGCLERSEEALQRLQQDMAAAAEVGARRGHPAVQMVVGATCCPASQLMPHLSSPPQASPMRCPAHLQRYATAAAGQQAAEEEGRGLQAELERAGAQLAQAKAVRCQGEANAPKVSHWECGA